MEKRMSKNESRLLEEGARYFQIELSEKQIQQFMDYYELLIEWNQVMNLTAITEFDEVMQKHFVDSLALAGVLNLNACKNLIDVGTGAGFPGIPLKIAFPHLHVILLDSLNKRIRFLNEVIDKLGLFEIKAIHGRAEDMARKKEYRQSFDLCVSRAVSNLSTLSEYCIPYTKIHGHFVSYKSGNVEEELRSAKKAITLLGGTIKSCEKFSLPGSRIERSLIFIEKEKKTPEIYPRKAGIPGKEPL